MRDRIEAIMAEWPELTFPGFFVPTRESEDERSARKLEDRSRMLQGSALAQFELSRLFIAENLEAGPTARAKAVSYNLKHAVEQWAKANGNPAYVSNGIFIAAMLDSGFEVGRITGPNCTFNVTSSSLKAIYAKPF